MTFQFTHISDLHLPPLPAVGLHQILNKRLLGYLSWHRKRKHRHRQEVVAALEESLIERDADHICITGDITNLGLPGEFQAAGRWLERFAVPEKLTFVPGNHDAYIPASVDAMHGHFARWLPDAFPSVTRQGEVAFIGVSSAVPSLPLLATGRVGRAQLRRLESVLDQTRGEDLFRVLMIHHPPGGLVRHRKALTDADALARVLGDGGVDLVLHGHGHHAAHYQLASSRTPIPVFGAGSATLSHPDTARTGHYYLFELNERELGVTHYHYRPGKQQFVATSEATIPRRSFYRG